ncbi:MAG: lipid-A-disaccharide synthase [Arenimonas sp.]
MTAPAETPDAPACSTSFGPRIAVVAGEASGDQLGAGLVRELRRRFPGAQFVGVGGAGMRQAGLDTWHDCDELAVMGLAEVLRHLPRLWRLRRALYRRLAAWQPDVFVGIDAPDFNLGLERRLKHDGVLTVHYVSPSVWAWRRGRAARIGRSADRVLCLFPMEPPVYAEHGVDARFVGHPLADKFALQPDRHAARLALGLNDTVPVLAMLPGSRLGEIERLAATFLAAADLVAAQVPDLHVLIPAANASCRAQLQAQLDARANGAGAKFVLLDGQAHAAMIASDAVLLASGTAALEALLAHRPMVVGYRVAPLTHFIARRLGLLKIDRVSLPNVLADAALVPELMQDDCTPERLAATLLPFFQDPAAVALLEPHFRAIHVLLRRDADHQAADAIACLLERQA